MDSRHTKRMLAKSKEEVPEEKKSCRAKTRGEGVGNKYRERGKCKHQFHVWESWQLVLINEEIDKRSDVLEVDDRGTQDESMSELEQEIEELKNKLQEAKEKTNALVIQLNEMKQQLVNFDNTVRQFWEEIFLFKSVQEW